MLLNEFLKEHRKVQQLEANALQQQKEIETLTAVIQKVSAQVEVNKICSAQGQDREEGTTSMNTVTQLKERTSSLVTLFTIGCVALALNVQAVDNPPPDGD